MWDLTLITLGVTLITLGVTLITLRDGARASTEHAESREATQKQD